MFQVNHILAICRLSRRTVIEKMNISLILTKQCNLRCKYCFETHENVCMTEETALRAIDMAVNDGGKFVGVSFFGGEPLLCKPLIYRCLEYSTRFPYVNFSWNMTTNGLLLDEEFLEFAIREKIEIAMSHDGLMSRVNRLYPGGKDCLDQLDEKLRLLLKYRPDAFIMATVTPATSGMAFDSLKHLIDLGVRRFNLAIDARPCAGWDEDSMELLSDQLGMLGDLILEKFRGGEDIYFNSFEEKILAVLKDRPCHVCKLGKRKPYIDWDGKIYPCIQFGGVPDYQIGSVADGIDEEKRNVIYKSSLSKPSFCEGCAMQKRCVNDCACLNYQQCGDTAEVSGEQCRYQQILITRADEMARKMLEADERRFSERYLKVKK